MQSQSALVLPALVLPYQHIRELKPLWILSLTQTRAAIGFRLAECSLCCAKCCLGQVCTQAKAIAGGFLSLSQPPFFGSLTEAAAPYLLYLCTRSPSLHLLGFLALAWGGRSSPHHKHPVSTSFSSLYPSFMSNNCFLMLRPSCGHGGHSFARQ